MAKMQDNTDNGTDGPAVPPRTPPKGDDAHRMPESAHSTEAATSAGHGGSAKPAGPAGSRRGTPRQGRPFFDPEKRPRPRRHQAGERIDEYLRRVRETEKPHEEGVEIPTKLYRVSEIANHFHLTRQTVHNYATIGLITERRRTPGGQRLFDESVFHRLHRIGRLKGRYRLHEIRQLLDAPDAAPDAQTDLFGPASDGREEPLHHEP